ncbi:MAG: RidA family protein [Arthrobacter sp.]|jgi:enamine deaminase RidA (YjgF/YER057c/UK114 family)|nr:RidA family protein [Arthrobacter sp.]
MHDDALFVPPPAALRRWSDSQLWVSGQVGADASWRPVGPGVEEQMRAAFANLAAQLEAEGLALSDVVFARNYLTDAEDFDTLNRVWAEVFPDAPPARTTVVVGLIPPFRFEVEAIAQRSPRRP